MRFLPKFTALVALFFIAAFAKTAHAQGDLPGSQVRVEKLFDARLSDAKRIEPTPTLPQIDTSIVAQRYEVLPVETEIAYDPPKIRPLAVKTDAPPQPYKGFARAGVGFPLGWIGDASYLTSNDKIALRGDLHTYGFDGNYNEDQKYAEVDTRLGATYYSNAGIAFDLDLSYDRTMLRYYGYREAVQDTSVVLPDELLKQHFGIFGFHAGLRNSKPTVSGIDYFFKIGNNLLVDNFATKENNFLIELGGRKDFGDNWYAEAAIDIDLTSFSSDSDQTLHNYLFKPTVGAHFDQLGYRIGATVANSNDTFRVFPNLEVSYSLGGGIVVVAGADGGLRKNNYTGLTEYNPFLVRDPLLRNAEEWRIYGGIQGQKSGINYKATASYSRINNLAVFFQDSAKAYQFRPAYDTANVIGLRVEASMPVSERISGRLQVENRIFSLRRFDKPYLVPSFDAQLTLGYEVIPDKFTAKAMLIAQNALPYLNGPIGDTTSTNVTDLTSTLVDLSIHGTYYFSKNIGAFGQLNNILNNRRRKFPFYPQLGANILVGVVAKF